MLILVYSGILVISSYTWLQIFVENYSKVACFFFFDKLSLLFCLMSIFIAFLCYIYIQRTLAVGIKPLLCLVTLTELLVLLCFSVRNIISFYVFFELLLFPMCLLILIYGSRGRRVYASISFFVYTFLGSLFIIIGMFFLYTTTATLNFDTLLYFNYNTIANKHLIFLVFIFFWIGFSIKLPTIPLHLWLPEAHVEAPTVGSVLLAAILLKLGAFGMFRIIVPLTQTSLLSLRIIPIIFCTLSVFYGSFLAFRHYDIKKIIAYSSIVHMNFAALAFLLDSRIGLIGCLIGLLAHSLVSSALFFSAGFFYEKMKTRNLLYYSSLFNQNNYVFFILFVVLIANMSFPCTVSFLGEMLVFCGLCLDLFNLFIIMLISSFFSGLFCFMLIYRLIYFNQKQNNALIQYTVKNQIYISPFSVNNLMTFTTSELFALGFLSFLIIFLFFFNDIFCLLASQILFLY
jgi:proton-translocating NADH-quinone oxidoreductase chain M